MKVISALGIAVLSLLSCIVLLVGFFAVVAACDPSSSSPSVSASHVQQDVIDTCYDAVKKMLKDPDSARFSDWTASEGGSPPVGMAYNPSAGDEPYTAHGMVNAKNGFGGYNGDEPYACDAVVTNSTVRAQARTGS